MTSINRKVSCMSYAPVFYRCIGSIVGIVATCLGICDFYRQFFLSFNHHSSGHSLLCLLFKTRRFGDFIRSPSSGEKYSGGPFEASCFEKRQDDVMSRIVIVLWMYHLHKPIELFLCFMLTIELGWLPELLLTSLCSYVHVHVDTLLWMTFN
jgi:hypothetical protein